MGIPPSVVVTLPARDLAGVRTEAKLAHASGADAAEVRLDRLVPGSLDSLHELFPAPLPLQATLRSRAEGGEGPEEPAARRAILESALSAPFRFVDLEWERDRSWWEREPIPTTAAVVASRHLTHVPAGTDWERALEGLAGAPGLTKLVFPATVGQVLHEILPRLSERAPTGATVLTTGASGPILRVLGRRIGSPLVYAALPEVARTPPVEPSQIPADRLAPFLRADGSPPWFAVVGHPVAHSLSPRIHHEWMREEGRVGLYTALDLTVEDEFAASLEELAEWGARGLNVTQPFKLAAFQAATRAEKGAEACGAANCLTFDGSEITAENTDLAAILRRLTELVRSTDRDPEAVAVIGAGGAARATLAAARLLGLPATVYARRTEEARAVAREYEAAVGSAHDAEPAPLVVHATNAGRSTGDRLDLPLDRLLSSGCRVVDWVYAPEEGSIRAAAERHGATYEDGRRLLVYQAAAAYSVWWGAEPSDASVQRVLEAL